MTEAKHTPAAEWREKGEPDPHAGHYDCERHNLLLGKLTDDEMANAVYLHGDSAYYKPSLEGLVTGTEHTSGTYLTAAKDRIRWLSRRLVTAEQHRDALQRSVDFLDDQATKLLQQHAELLNVRSDAERFLKLSNYFISERTDADDTIVACNTVEDLRAAVDGL